MHEHIPKKDMMEIIPGHIPGQKDQLPFYTYNTKQDITDNINILREQITFYEERLQELKQRLHNLEHIR